MLIEIHMLQSHAPSNLNRDDTGSPKDAWFGGHLRARISSQCIKRSIRTSPLMEQELGEHLAVRTRRFPELLQAELRSLELDDDAVRVIAAKATQFGKGEAPASEGTAEQQQVKAGKPQEPEHLETRQLMFCSAAEVGELATALASLYERVGAQAFAKMNPEGVIKELGAAGASLPRSVDIALFGRMTTQPAPFANVEAAMQVAHAISTHAIERQFDYFTAVDDLKMGDETGAGHLGDIEFNAAVYYKYFSLDWDEFIDDRHLAGDADVARRAVAVFIRAAALTTPTGKQNSFAAHNPPDAILVEVKPENIPVSYANAFVDPARPDSDNDLVEASIKAFAGYAAKLRTMYGLPVTHSWWLCSHPIEFADATSCVSLPELIAALDGVLAGR